MNARAQLVLVLVCAGFAPGCAGFWHWPFGSTQRWPGPMESLADPLPKGDADQYPRGPEEVLVLRHADPVQVRPAGLRSSFPLAFYNKDLRVNSGSAVYSAPGGRVEVLWPDGTSVVLSGRSEGIVGSKSRGEPSFIFRQIERAQLDLKQNDQIELIGGAQLSAHSGPFILDHFQSDILRVKNQSKSPGEIAFRDAVFVLDPGELIDLPLLSAGGKPVQSDAGLQKLAHQSLAVQYSGALAIQTGDDAVSLSAESGDSEVHALGVKVRMQPGEKLRISGLKPGATKETLAPALEAPAPVAPATPAQPASGEVPAATPPVTPEAPPVTPPDEPNDGQQTPPVETPPSDTPPSDTPPSDTPPSDTPPGDTPPGDTPPGDTPPGDTPPGDEPPDEKPPDEQPPGATATEPRVTTSADRCVRGIHPCNDRAS